jgi:hypothetical protein
MSTIRSARSASSAATTRQHGIGLVGSLAGVVVFLMFLLFAVQLAYDLYATSAVTSAAFDAVRVVAGSDAAEDSAARSEAEESVRRVLGRYGERVTFTWTVDDDVVALRVEATNPSFLPTALRRPLRLDEVDRTVRARVERLR